MIKPSSVFAKVCQVSGNHLVAQRADSASNASEGGVGSFVYLPRGENRICGIISSGKMDYRNSVPTQLVEIQMIGEVDRNNHFERGVSVAPSLDSDVYLLKADEMNLIFGSGAKEGLLKIGTSSQYENLSIHLNLDRLFNRHAAIVGSTGSGKSNTVAVLIRQVAENYPNSQVVIIDPHGEYGSAFPDISREFSVYDKKNPLFIPFWALSFDELAWFLVDRRDATETQQDKILRDRICHDRKRCALSLKSGAIEPHLITADTPIPFDLKQIWYDLGVEEHATMWERDHWGKLAYKTDVTGRLIQGSAEKVIPAEFLSANPSNENPPYASNKRSGMGAYLSKMYLRLKDKSYDFLLNPGEYDGAKKDLSELVESWIGHDKPVTILNLKGISFEVMDLVIGVVTRILFQSMLWQKQNSTQTKRPLLLVYEEAHSYLPKKTDAQFVTGYARLAARRIFKEGRKYGTGAIVVSQRPSELDESILSECGTFFALRLSNSLDQSLVRALLPDNLNGLFEMLPGLKTGQALIAGEAVKMPVCANIPLVEPKPQSRDSDVEKAWREKRPVTLTFTETISSWRQQHRKDSETNESKLDLKR